MKYLPLFESFDEDEDETYLSLKDVLVALGYKNPRKIAKGGSSTIWVCSNTDNIIKLTNNYTSANTMQYVKNNIDHPNFINIKKIYKVLSNDKDLMINDMNYNWNPYILNKYPLYVIETEDLEQLSKKDIKNLDCDYLLELCEEHGIRHQDLHKDNLMKRKSDNEIVLIDLLDDSLPKQDISTQTI